MKHPRFHLSLLPLSLLAGVFLTSQPVEPEGAPAAAPRSAPPTAFDIRFDRTRCKEAQE